MLNFLNFFRSRQLAATAPVEATPKPKPQQAKFDLPRGILPGLARLCDPESSRFALRGVQVRRDDTGITRLAATNGRSLAVVELRTTGEGRCTVIMPRADCRAVRPSKSGRLPGNVATLSIHGTSINVQACDGTGVSTNFVGESIEGRFPKVKDVIPKFEIVTKAEPKQAARIFVRPDLLIDLLRVAMATVTDDENGRGVYITVPICDPDSGGEPITVSGDLNGVSFVGVLMPIVREKSS
jgi:hypothetical protein